MIPGRDASAVLSDMWWFDLANELWHPATDFVNVTGPVPSARFMAAGGVYPGSDVLWLSMGQDASGRKLSDSWTFNASSGEDTEKSTVFLQRHSGLKMTLH